MVTYVELVLKYGHVKNDALAAFEVAMKKQIEAFNKGETNRRSWVKEGGKGYLVKLGKLDDEFDFASAEDVLSFFEQIKQAIKDDPKFVSEIERVYGNGEAVAETKPKRGRKPKTA